MKEKPLIGLARKETLKSYHILDTLPEKDFDAITELAAYICETPISLVSLSDDKRQIFKSRHGFKISETPIENSFCFHALARPDQPFIIPDAVKDHRFKNCSLVTQYPNVAFYAGIPLKTSEGVPIGTLCVMDHQPRNINENQLNALTSLANQVEQLLELRKSKLITKGILQKLEKEQDFSKKLIENNYILGSGCPDF